MRKCALLPLFLVLAAPAAADPFPTPSERELIRAPRYVSPPSPNERAQRVERSDFADNRPGAPRPGSLGGGFIEFLFTGRSELPRSRYQRPWQDMADPHDGRMLNVRREDPAAAYQSRQTDPRYEKQIVEYPTKEAPGTLIIDTNNRFLYYVQGGGQALRYGVGVGRPGFEWAGVKTVSQMKEWPDWRPPAEMLARRPDLPTYMAGGPENPLGARAIYLGSSLYRIHGSNEPWTIGTAVSSGCIRMRNEDVIDLYGRVKVGTKVIVI